MADDCGIVDVTCKATEAVDSATDGWATDMKETLEWMVETVFTGWIHSSVAVISTDVGLVSFLQAHLMVIAGMFLAISTVLFGIRLIFKPSREVIGSGARFYLRVLVVISGAVTIAQILIRTTDEYSTWIIDQATQGTGLADTLLNTMGLGGPASFFTMLFFGGIALFFTVIQGFLLALRNLALPLLVGASPVAVALSQSEVGQNWWSKYLSWFIAYLLYKPTAATIYASGFWLMANGNVLGSDSLGEAIIRGMNFINGAMVMLLAVASFRALMTVVTPITGKLTGGGAGAAVITASAVAATVSGAINKGASSGNPTTGGPTTVTPTNQAAGAPGAQGPTGSPAPGATPPPTPTGAGSVHPVAAGVQAAGRAAGQAQRGMSNGINPQEEQ